MDLAKVAARLRPRTSWEAMDLGLILVQHFFKPITLAWLACILPIFVLAATWAALTDFFWLPFLAVWLLKPLYDRVPLFVLSRAFFGDVPGVKETARHFVGRAPSGAVLADLTWRRFSPFRGVAMPVRDLERLGGAAARERLGVLLRRQVKSPAGWLMTICVATEVLFVGAAVMLITMVLPESVGVDVGAQVDLLFQEDVDAPLLEAIAFGLYFLATSATEIAYVAASFGLYINRRVRLEGWDIEIAFKKLAQRLRARARSAVEKAAMVLLVAAGCLGVAEAPAYAQDDLPAIEEPASGEPTQLAQPSQTAGAAPVDPLAEQAREVGPAQEVLDPQEEVEKILEAPEFGTVETETRWQLRKELFDLDTDEQQAQQDAPDLSGMQGIYQALGTTIQIVMWILAGGAVIAAAFYFFKKVQRPAPARAPEEPLEGPQVEVIEAEQPKKVTLSADIVEAAMLHWQSGEHAESLSVLYRGTIRGLAKGYRIEIDSSLTARECVNEVRSAGGPADYVSELAAAFTSTVWADRPIDDAQARALFAAWKDHFQRTAR